MSDKKVERVCSVCKKSGVLFDAYAAWGINEQDYIVHATFDTVYCPNCEADIEFEEVEI